MRFLYSQKYFWHVLTVLLVLALAGVTFFWLSQSSLLAIETIEIEGNRAISNEEILDRAGPFLDGESLLNLSFDDAERSLVTLPFVDGVEIKRDFPHTVHLRIREFRPFVNLMSGNGILIVAAEGRALTEAPSAAPQFTTLSTKEPCPVKIGEDVDCQDVHAGLWFLTNIPMSFDQEFAEVNVADGDINARTRRGINVHFGNLDEYYLKLEVLRRLLARAGTSGTDVFFDVSVPQRPVTRENIQTVSTATTAANAEEYSPETQAANPEEVQPGGGDGG